MVAILKIAEGLWVLEEEGQNVLFKDSVAFGLSKAERKHLFWVISMVASCRQQAKSLAPYIKCGYIKKLDRQVTTKNGDVWEARDLCKGGRIIFIIDDNNTVIVAAVHKSRGKLSHAINRGIKRWKKYLKSHEKYP